MGLGWTKNRISPIAIDYGADSLKLLQVMLTDPPQLVAAGAVSLPAEAIRDASARRGFYTEAIKRLVSQNPFKGKRAICSIPAHQMLVQHIQVSKNEEDTNQQIEMHLRERLNVDPSRMVVRHFRVGEVIRDGATRSELICMAVSRQAAFGHIEMAHRAKLDVVGMHSEAVAIHRAFGHLFHSKNEEAERTICFVDIGAATTKVVMVHNDQIAFAKTIHAAGRHLTSQYAQDRGIGLAEARRARMGNLSEAAGSRGGAGGVTAVAQAGSEIGVRSSVSENEEGAANEPPAMEVLIDELQMCVRYYRSAFPSRSIEKLVFLGGESHHVATCQSIAKALRIVAQLGDPLARVVKSTGGGVAEGVDLNRSQPGWAVPMGLCLCEANL